MKKIKAKLTELIGVKFDIETYKEIEKIADENERKPSDLIRVIVKNYIKTTKSL